MPKSLRWLIALAICLSTAPLGASAGQIVPAEAYSCPTEVQNPPEDAPTAPVAILGVSAVPQGESVLIDQGGPSERTYTVVSTDYFYQLHERTYADPGIIICLKVQYAESATDLIFKTAELRIGPRGESSQGVENPEDTRRWNFTQRPERVIPIAFPGQNGQTQLYLTSIAPEELSSGGGPGWAMLVDLEAPPSPEARPSTTPRATQAPTVASGPARGTVTEFNQPTVITLGLTKWRLTFDPVVEVRTFIGDSSIVPTRGQFLVIWFNQLSQGGDPLPLGNFTLQTSTGAGEPFAVRPLAQEGTAALIITEYTWNPNFMSTDTEYRTGIVFDIAPEDTHFVLQYQGPSGGLGNPYVVDLEFDA